MKKLSKLFYLFFACLLLVLSGCNADQEQEAKDFFKEFRSTYGSLDSDEVLPNKTEGGLKVTYEFVSNDIVDEKKRTLKSSLPNGGLDSTGDPLKAVVIVHVVKSGEVDITKQFTIQVDNSELSDAALKINTAKGILKTNFHAKEFSTYGMKKVESSTKYYLGLTSYNDVNITYSNYENDTFFTFDGTKAYLDHNVTKAEYDIADDDSSYVTKKISYTMEKDGVSITDTITVLLRNTELSLESALSVSQINALYDNNTVSLKSTSYLIYGKVSAVLMSDEADVQCFYMQDDNGESSSAFYIYMTYKGTAGYEEVHVGDTVLVKTKVDKYDGYRESQMKDSTGSVTVIEPATGEETFNSLEINSTNYSTLNTKQSQLAHANGLVYLGMESVSSGKTIHTISCMFSDLTTTASLFADKNSDDILNIYNFFKNLKPGTVIDIPYAVVGMTSNEIRINILHDPVKSADSNQLTKEQLASLVTKSLDTFAPQSCYLPNANISTIDPEKILATETVLENEITWSIKDPDNHKFVTVTSGILCVDGSKYDSTAEFTLVASWTDVNNNVSTYEFTVYAVKAQTVKEMVEDFKAGYVLKGYVAIAEDDYVVIADNSGQIKVNYTDMDLSVGDYVELIIASKSGNTLTASSLISSSETREIVAPMEVSFSELGTDSLYVLIDEVTIDGNGQAINGNVTVTFINGSNNMAAGTYKGLVGNYIVVSATEATFTLVKDTDSLEEINSMTTLSANVSFYGTFIAGYSKDGNRIHVADKNGNVVLVYSQKQNFINVDLLYGDTLYIEGLLQDTDGTLTKGITVTAVSVKKCGISLGFSPEEIETKEFTGTDDIELTVNNKINASGYGVREVYTIEFDLVSATYGSQDFKIKVKKSATTSEELSIYSIANTDSNGKDVGYGVDDAILKEIYNKISSYSCFSAHAKGLFNKAIGSSNYVFDTTEAAKYTFTIKAVVNKYESNSTTVTALFIIPTSFSYTLK